VNIAEAFSLAVQHHESGRLREAEVLYRQILQAEGNHPDALHLLGVLTHQAGQTATALGLIQKAINHNSQNPHYHTNLGNV
jgi:Flp pilus assembly protein TadD